MRRILLALAALALTFSAAADVRGLVLSAKDLSGNLDWPKIAHEAGVGTLATHIGPKDVIPFLKGEKGRRFVDGCRKYGLALEHELHAIEYLLPRELFATEPELFRMDTNGVRTADANCCASNPRARAIIASNAVEVAKVCRSSTGRYFYWLTDDAPVCACGTCRGLSAADQAVLIENEIVGALRRMIDPKATLSHLAYLKTLEPPRQVKPDPALFLEFAPIRRWDGTEKREDFREGGAYAQALDGLLAVFPAETAQVLEYWLDESLFCDWTDRRVRIPWDAGRTARDLAFYARRGIRNYTTFAVSLDDAYVAEFGTNDLGCVRAYADALKTALRPLPDGVSFAEEKTTGLVRLENRYGRLEVSLKGAQIRSYAPAGVGEVLYRPKAMDFSGATENRGGIPVCWPWFGRNGEPGSQAHGYARHSDFAFGGVRRFNDGTLELTLELRPTPENLKLWPHEVELDYRITLGPKLVLELETRNAGKESVVITEGVHPYWAVSDRRQVKVDGLDGLRYCFADESTVDDRTWKGSFVPDGHFDHVFRLKGGPVVISDSGNGRRITLQGTGYSKLVIWTPAPFADGDFENLSSADMSGFVCVEPATLFRPDAYSLAPGARHVMHVEIGVSTPLALSADF